MFNITKVSAQHGVHADPAKNARDRRLDSHRQNSSIVVLGFVRFVGEFRPSSRRYPANCTRDEMQAVRRVRMIVVTVAGAIFMVIQALMPDFPVSEEGFTQAVWVLFGGLVLGEALEGAKEKLTPVWLSWL